MHVSLDVDDEAPVEVEGLVVGVVVVPTSVVVGPDEGDVELGVPDVVVLAGADVSDDEFVEDVVELPHATSVSAVTTHTTSGRDLTPKVCTANPGCSRAQRPESPISFDAVPDKTTGRRRAGAFRWGLGGEASPGGGAR